MKLTILGTSKSAPKLAWRGAPGYFIQSEDQNILLDCADGVTAKLHQLGLSAWDIDVLVISHFHPDHFSVSYFLQELLVRQRRETTQKNLTIIGPNGLRDKVKLQYLSQQPDETNFQLLLQQINIEFIEQPAEIQLGRANFSTFPVVHSNNTAVATRISWPEYVLAYSGDSSHCAGLIDSAKDSDLFLCEAANEGRPDDLHLTIGEVERLFDETNTKKILVVHHDLDPDTYIAPTGSTIEIATQDQVIELAR